jgi:hypothetical protein
MLTIGVKAVAVGNAGGNGDGGAGKTRLQGERGAGQGRATGGEETAMLTTGVMLSPRRPACGLVRALVQRAVGKDGGLRRGIRTTVSEHRTQE